MLEGFSSLFEEGADILVSEESGDYRPEAIAEFISKIKARGT